MPLEAEYTWRQTADSLIVEIPLKGASAKAVDILATELLIKVSFERFLLHLDLLGPIDDTSCVAKIKQGTLNLRLRKRDPGAWPSLVVEGLSKEERKARRAAALESKAERETQLAERAKLRKVTPCTSGPTCRVVAGKARGSSLSPPKHLS